MNEQTSTEIQTAQPVEDRVIYKLGRAPMHQSMAALHGARNGLLAAQDLPDVVALDCSREEYDAYCIALDKVVRESGAMAGYLAEIKAEAVAADCPWWCDGKHAALDVRLMGEPPHETAVCRVDFDSKRPSATFTISACPGDPLKIYADELGADSHPYDADEARSIAQALTLAADRLDQIRAATA